MYCDLVKNVKEAFEVCDLVRINCKGMNTSDFKKIGAKLKVGGISSVNLLSKILPCTN